MNGERYEFNAVSRLEPDAIGQPGNRRFRLVLEGDVGAASIWMEKEQLQALGLAIDQLLAPLAVLWTRAPQSAPAAPRPVDVAQPAGVEFQVARLALAYDEESQHFVLLMHDAQADQEGPATLSCRATRAQMRALSQGITALISAGRPRCPLCGQPVEGGQPHVCPGTNGHGTHE